MGDGDGSRHMQLAATEGDGDNRRRDVSTSPTNEKGGSAVGDSGRFVQFFEEIADNRRSEAVVSLRANDGGGRKRCHWWV